MTAMTSLRVTSCCLGCEGPTPATGTARRTSVPLKRQPTERIVGRSDEGRRSADPGRSISDMAYEFVTSQASGIFIARVGGVRHVRLEDNDLELRAFWASVSAGMKRAGVHRLLAVISAQGAIRSLDVRTFYRSLGTMGFTSDMRLAIVFAVPEPERPILQLGVDAAARDGWTINHFVSEREALEWL